MRAEGGTARSGGVKVLGNNDRENKGDRRLV